MTQPMLALFGLGGGQIVLLLAMLLLAGLAVLAVLAGTALFIAWLVRRDKSKAAAQPPFGAASPTPPAPRTCPRCGAIVPAESPQGLCPRCVLGVGLATQTEETDATGPPGTKAIKAVPPPSEIARHFPQLEILESLGRGGMGVVYKARQPKLDRLVALKILAPEKGDDPKFAERFLREAQALARLNHPNIVTVHDFGEADGMFFLLMEFVEGASLRQLLQTGKLKPEEALAIVPRICEALQYAHELGIVHRDIKPENVLLDKQGRVKIADFGIAKIIGPATGPQSLTEARQIVGTPHYMAPEQVEKPQTVDHRADIYSLGVVLYEMLTGELPLGKFAPPSRKVQVDVRLDEVVLHALEKEPDRRYQHAREVKTDVETIAGTAAAPRPLARQAEPRRASRVLKLAIGLGLVGTLALVALLALWLADLRFGRPHAVAAPPGLVGWWPGEGNAKDIVGGNDGELVGGVSFAPGRVGQAFRFDGVSGCVINDEPGMTSILDSYTMEFWARPSAERASTPEATSGIAGINGQRFAIFPHNGQLGAVGSGVSIGINGVSVFEHGSVYLASLLVYDAPIRDWTHVAVVYENRQPRLYLNGTLVRVGLTSTRSSYPSTWLGEAGPDRLNSANGYYAGLLDEVRIYNRPLSPAEIQGLYEEGRGNKLSVQTVPAAGPRVPRERVPKAMNAEESAPAVVRSPTPWLSQPAGCVAQWRADGNGRDSVGGHDALLLDGITFAPGQVGQAFRFDGVGGAVQVPAAPALDVGEGNGLTIAAWIKPVDVSVQRPLVEWNDAHGFMGTQFWIAVAVLDGGPGSLWGNLVDTSGGDHQISTLCGLVLPNVFQHVALAYDKPSGLAVLYLNGNETAQTNLGSFTPYTSSDLYFGLRPSGVSAGNRYVGFMDEVEIYSRALSPGEIQTLYQAGSAGKWKPGPQISPTSLTQRTAPQAQDVLAQMRQRYAQASSVVADGRTFSITEIPGQPDFTSENRFQIALGRPSLYRVEWSPPAGQPAGGRGAVWCDGGEDWFWMNDGRPERQASREMALGAAGGVSALATQTLPALFFGDAPWADVLRDVRSEPDAVVGGETCFVIAGAFQNTRTRLWISQRNLLLRQFEQLSTDRPQTAAQPAAYPEIGRTFRTRQLFEHTRLDEPSGKVNFRFSPPRAK